MTDEECDLARELLRARFEKAERERRELKGAWGGLLMRVHAMLQKEDRLNDLPDAINSELDRLENHVESMRYFPEWKKQLREWADEYLASGVTFGGRR